MTLEIHKTEQFPFMHFLKTFSRACLASFLLTTAVTFAADSPVIPGDSIAIKPEKGIGILGMVHSSFAVSDLDRALHFYIEQLGLEVAFRVDKPDGTPRFIYIKISDETFVELFPNVTRPPPQSPMWAYHFGLVVKNLQATLHALEARGYPMPTDAYERAAKLAVDGTFYYNIKDPDGNSIELSQYKPDSLLLKSSRKLTELVQSTEKDRQ